MQTSVTSQSIQASSYSVCVIHNSKESLALSALLTLSGHSVVLQSDSAEKIPNHCLIRSKEGIVAKEFQLPLFASVKKGFKESVKDTPFVVVIGGNAAFNTAAHDLANHLSTGQTIVLVDAPIGAALEFGQILQKQKKQNLSVNILETGKLFDQATIENNSLNIFGMQDTTSICGRTINETRAGLDLGGSFGVQLLPSSNLLERSFYDWSKTIRPLLALFALLASSKSVIKSPLAVLTPAVKLTIETVKSEIRSLAQAYNVSSTKSNNVFSYPKFGQMPLTELKALMIKDICENLTLFVQLARTAHIALPVTESLIELAQAISKNDLKNSGRQLSNLGLAGMDLQEIVELVNS